MAKTFFAISWQMAKSWLMANSQFPVVVHLPVHGHFLKGFHFSFTHRVVGSVVVEDHGALVCALKGLVASAAACEAFEGTCLDGLIGWGR